MPFPGQARPRPAGPALGSDSFSLPSPSPSAPLAQGRPDGLDAVPARPVGVAVPLLAGTRARAVSPRHPAFGTRRVHRPTRPPERGPLPTGTVHQDRSLAHLARTAVILAGLRERPRREKEERGSVGTKRGAPTEVAQSHQLILLSLLFTCCGQWLGTGSILVKPKAGGFLSDSALSLNINKRLKSQLRGS